MLQFPKPPALDIPAVSDADIGRHGREAERYAMAYERIMAVLDDRKLTREEKADVLARDYAAMLSYYQERS
jgi:hypothetical protein